MRIIRAHIRGFTLQELIVVIIASTMLAVLVMPMTARRTRCGNSKQLKDATQISQIHKGMLIFANDHGGLLQTPGVFAVARAVLSDPSEQYSVNHSAALYSMSIAQNLFQAELLVGPTEINPIVQAKADYNYDAYNPRAGDLWDESFQMRLDDPTVGANASYAHAALCGDRMGALMNMTSPPYLPIVGARGVRGGVGPGHPDHDNSLTLQLFGSPKTWDGNICFSDNHVEFLSTFTPPGVTYRGSLSAESQADNIFVAEFAHPRGNQAAADAFLGVFTEATKHTVKDVYDTDALRPR